MIKIQKLYKIVNGEIVIKYRASDLEIHMLLRMGYDYYDVRAVQAKFNSEVIA